MANDGTAGGIGPRSIAALAAAPLDEVDLALLDRLAAEYAQTDPVPDGLVERVQFAMTLDALHAEIAQLTRMDDLVGARAEAASEAQTVTFTSSSTSTMITVTPTGADRARIDGWATDAAGIAVELRTVDGSLHTQADEDGRFVFEDVPRGMVQFVLRHPEDTALPPVVTPALEI
jgi:hypothetical protein